ncbi:MAG: phosphate butyryltransferase [Eubacteriales bacterium]|nr:phosphate butyryltransferase [Eubacteriales bacterium]
MQHSLNEFVERARGLHLRVAVASAHDEDVLRSVLAAREQGICSALLFGKAEKIREILAALQAGEAGFTIIEPEDGSDEACARAAVAAVVDGEANYLMKGILNTTIFLRAVVHSELMRGALLSHVMLFEFPAYHKLLFLTDGAMNPAPDFEKKRIILENAARLLSLIGYNTINAACISGSEVVSEKIPSTMDAKALAALDWSGYHMTVFGPVALDLAISPAACAHKRYSAAGAGDADLLLMPNYETGNCLGKSLVYFAQARSAGLVMGARCPIVLVSRADPADAKLTSLALGAIAVDGGKQA